MEQSRQRYTQISNGLLARIPAIGILLFLIGITVFSVLAFNVVTDGPLLAWDKPFVLALNERATQDNEFTVDAMRFSGDLGTYFATVIGLLVALYFIKKRYFHEFAMLMVGVLGGAGWFYLLSRFFGRQRPVLPEVLDPIHVPGFPSGHSMTAMLLYGLLLYLVYPHLKSPGWRLVAIFDAVMLIILVGFSRLYMGSHYPTDVLAGYAFGLAWGALVYTTIELYRQRNTARKKR